MTSGVRTRVNENGRIVIPYEFRNALGIHAGDEVLLRIEDEELRVTTVERRLKRAQALVGKHLRPGESLAAELIADRHRSARDE